MEKSEFQTNLQELMEMFGFDDEYCARHCDVSRATFKRWRKGFTAPSSGRVRQLICDALQKEGFKQFDAWMER